MELLALVLINIVFGVILYYAVSIKVTNSVRDYQIVKLKKEIQAHTLSFFKESESYLALMDSRIAILKNLLQKAESMGVNFENLPELEKPNPKFTFPNSIEEIQEQPKPAKPNTANNNYPQAELKPKTQTNTSSKRIQPTQKEEEGFFSGFVAGLGKGLKSMFGVPDTEMINFEREPTSKTKKNSVIDVSIGGNPLDTIDSVRDNLKEDNFQTILNNSYQEKPKVNDKVSISIASALEELPADSTKVEKVVHLLKKGYSHSEISDEMGLAIPEISLIETIKIERSRRI